MRITKRAVEALEPRDRDYFAWDDGTKGFGVRVWPSGRKSFVLQFRDASGDSRRVVLGDFDAMKVEDARRAAATARADVLTARHDPSRADPARQRTAIKAGARADREAPTVQDLAADFLADRRAKGKASTVREYQRFLERDVLPVLGRMKAAAVTRRHIQKMHLAMEERPYMANRVLAVVSAMLTFAEVHGHRSPGTNPCGAIRPYPEKARERFLSSSEFAALGAALTRAELEGIPAAPKRARKPKSGGTSKHRPKSAGQPIPANPFAVAAVRLLLLSGWREGEAVSLRWDAVDFERGVVTLADSKTGRSVRHIGAPALALLADLPRLQGSPYCFPGAKAGAHIDSVRRLWEAVRHAAGLEGVRLHDLRHAFAAVGAGGGLSLHAIGMLLGHREVSTTQRYAHLADDPRRLAANQVSGSVAALLAGERPDDAGPSADILPFPRRAGAS